MWDPFNEFESATLPNGLNVHAATWSGRPWEFIGFMIHSGARYDPEGREGLAHFVEHLILENAGLDRRLVEDFFHQNGGQVNFGQTFYFRTYYCFFVPSDRETLKKALSFFGRMLLCAKLNKMIEHERKIILHEFCQRYPVKYRLEVDWFKVRSVYAGQWLERFVRPIGTPDSINHISKNDLQAYYDRHYVPANVSVVGVGGLKIAELVEMLSDSPFAICKEGRKTTLIKSVKRITPPLVNRKVFPLSKYISSNTPLDVCSYQSVAKVPGFFSEQIMALSALMLNAVLNDELREKRTWTYAISSCFCRLGGFYEFQVNCSEFSVSVIDKIEEVIEDCIGSIKSQQELFERVKRSMIRRNLMADLTAEDLCGEAIEDLTYFHRIVSLTEVGKILEDITMRDICDVFQYLTPEKRLTILMRP